jgi:hypothetical protein
MTVQKVDSKVALPWRFCFFCYGRANIADNDTLTREAGMNGPQAAPSAFTVLTIQVNANINHVKVTSMYLLFCIREVSKLAVSELSKKSAR